MVIYGVELVNRITVKKDGVYLSTHSRNDSAPYSSHRVGFLSDAYAEGGQKELDKQIFMLLYDHVELRGTHESVVRYRNVWDGAEGIEIHHDYEDKIRERFSMLNQEDQKNLYINNNSPGIQEFLKYKKEMQEIMFQQLAELCPPVSKRGTVTKSR